MSSRRPVEASAYSGVRAVSGSLDDVGGSF